MSVRRYHLRLCLFACLLVSAGVRAVADPVSAPALRIENAREASQLADTLASLHSAVSLDGGSDAGRLVSSGTRGSLKLAWLAAPGVLILFVLACVLMLFLRRGRAPARTHPAWRLLLTTAVVSLLGTVGIVVGVRWYGGRFPAEVQVLSLEVFGGDAVPTGRIQWAHAVASGTGVVGLGPDWDADHLWFRRQGARENAFQPLTRAELERTRMPALTYLEVVGVPRRDPGNAQTPPFDGEVRVPYTGTGAEAALDAGAAQGLEWLCVFRRMGTILTAVRHAADSEHAAAMRPLPKGAAKACARIASVLLPHADAVAAGELSGGVPSHRRVVLQSLPLRVEFPRERELVFGALTRDSRFPEPETGGVHSVLSNSSVTITLDCEPGYPLRADERVEQAALVLRGEWFPGENLDRAATVTVACRTDGSDWRPLASVFHKPVAEMNRQELLKEIRAVRATAAGGILMTYEKSLLQPESIVKPGIDHIECRVSHTGDGPPIRMHWIRLSLKLELEE